MVPLKTLWKNLKILAKFKLNLQMQNKFYTILSDFVTSDFVVFFYFASIILRLFRIHWSPRSGMVSTADQQTSVLWALTISLTIPVIVVSQVFCYCNIFLMISKSNEIECFWFPCSNSWSPQNASNFRFASLL